MRQPHAAATVSRRPGHAALASRGERPLVAGCGIAERFPSGDDCDVGIEFSGGSELGRGPERVPDRLWGPAGWLDRRPAEVAKVTRPELRDHGKTGDLSAGKRAGDAPKVPPARRFTVTIGHPGENRVVVEKITLDSKPRDIVINRSCGVQAGEHNRQFNEYRYELGRPAGSIDKVFDGHPLRQLAFAKLAANPGSVTASFFFRQLLPDRPAYSGGRIAFTDTSPGTARITARLDEHGAIVIKNSRGVQTGNWNTQRNKFHYHIEKPEFHLDAALRDPDLARALAVAASDPDNPAVQRAFIHRLGNYDGSSWTNGDVHLKHSDLVPRPVRGHGVQAGYSDRRSDTVRIEAGKVLLTGWERLKEHDINPGRDQRLQNEHQERILASQPPGSPADATAPGPEGFLNHFIKHAAAAALDRIAPGRRHLAAGMAEEIKAALGTFGEPAADDRSAEAKAVTARSGAPGSPQRKLTPIPGPMHPGYRFARETRRRMPASRNRDFPLSASSSTQAEDAHVNTTPLRHLSPARRCSRPRRAGQLPQVPSPRKQCRHRRRRGHPPPAAWPCLPQARPAPPRRRAARAAGLRLVPWYAESAAEIAAGMGRPALDAGLLLQYVRERAWSDRYDGRHQSVTRALRSVQALRVVLFLDPGTGKVMWVDVDPARQVPAAVLFMEADFSSGPPGRFRGVPV